MKRIADMGLEVGIIMMIALAVVVILITVGVLTKSVKGAEVEEPVVSLNYLKYECEKIAKLDKSHQVYKIVDIDNDKEYLYVTGEGQLYEIGLAVK